MATYTPDSAISLRWALLVYVVIPLITALLIADHQSLHALEGRIKNLLHKEIELIAQTLQLPLSRAVEALKAGADDFLTKPLDLEHLLLRIMRTLELAPSAAANETLSGAIRGRTLPPHGRTE